MEQLPATIEQLTEALAKQKDALSKGFNTQTTRIYLAQNNGEAPVTTTANLYKDVKATGEYPSEAFAYVYTGEVTSFTAMFWNCTNLTRVSYLDTHNGVDFQSMFGECRALTSVVELDTSNGTNFSQMFKSCLNLTTIPSLDTSNGIYFDAMFSDCTSLTSVPSLNTSNGVTVAGMFTGCTNLVSVPDLDTSNSTDFDAMFYNCASLTSIPDLDMSKAAYTSSMFIGCTSLTTLRDSPYATEGNRWQFCSSISFGSCPLDRTSILKVFNGLPNITATITVSSTTNGYLSAADKAIAENKGWTVAVA